MSAAPMERRAVDDGGHDGVNADSEIWLRRLRRRPGKAPLGGPPLSHSRLKRGRRGVVPTTLLPPLFPIRRGARAPLHDCQWGRRELPSTRLTGQGSVDLGPVD
ncbi:hypothetical protein Sjap_018519 [Stephania japonica]|uniref:Uncharacterized protein n=1 Tax=Stephania japonica TaxID=461633 RepID=A0AAP0I858_9MAGN